MGLYQWDCEFLTENDSLLLDDRKTSVEFQSENIGSMENDTVFKNRIFLVRSLPMLKDRPGNFNPRQPLQQVRSSRKSLAIGLTAVFCFFFFMLKIKGNKVKR